MKNFPNILQISYVAQKLYYLEKVEPQPLPSLLLRLEPVQSRLGVVRVMSEQRVPGCVGQRAVIKFLVGANVLSSEIFHRLGNVCLSGVRALEMDTCVCVKTAKASFGLFGNG
ncbi:hypothetical protein AVEN_124214-1 [Araneus ventricosus]|uniref:Uncharacterized protein n=1 Tax=Araneus ventricosus TaxID=182803 RepID=A0A4Y2N3T9_ARAVE|nr:hypothetical protein AVEN_124214-1 [Araneus ventricosus]